jgi:class 3 adenylate cyclase
MSSEACAACGAANPAAALFCGRCGATLGRECPSCGAVVGFEAAFCTSCGAAFEAAPPPPTAEERKVVSVLFADLVGFTGRAEHLDPEDVSGLLAPYHGRVRAELERFTGTVEKFIGDAVVALFGAPVAHGDDAERAVRAALVIREAIAELNEAEPSLALHVRIGVTTGEALVRSDARVSEGEGMAAGDVVNTAARLQAAAPVDGILVDDATHRLTQHEFEYREHESVSAKGKAAPVSVWEVVALRARRGVDIAFKGGAALVGRDDELDALRDAFARAARGRTTQLITLAGVPGMGKSRLVYELSAALDADPDLYAYWRQGRSLPYGQGVSFWALGEMAKAHAGILESDDAETAEAKLREAVGHAVTDASEAAWIEGHLRPLVGLGGDAGSEDRRSESFAAWRRFFESLAEQHPVVLVFEDLHWADDGLLDFIDHLVDWAGDFPLLVVCTARPELLERRPGWGGGKRNAATISLAPLSEDNTGRLLEALVGRAERELVSRSGGNPLYAEEYARMLAQRKNGGELPLPDSVHGIIAARLDTLPRDEKALVQDAAVLGKMFWAGELAHVAGIAPAAVAERLHGLERKEFVRRERRSSVAGDTAYVFRHVLVRDVAYGQIPRSRRAEKHRLAAEWIDSLAGDRREDLADMVAHHYSSALALARATGQTADELAERARHALREAGDRGAALNAFSAAARFYGEALALWPEADAERPRLLLDYGRAVFWAEAAGGEALESARAGLLAAGDRELAAEADVLLAELAWARGDRDAAFDRLENAAALLNEAPASRSKAYVLSSLSRFLMIADESEDAIRVGREALAMADELDLAELRAHALNNIGVARTSIGDPQGIADLERALALAEKINSLQSVRGYLNLGSIFAHLGELGRMFELHARGRAAAERFGDAVGMGWFAAEHAYELYWTGRWEEAAERAEALVVAPRTEGPHRVEIDGRLVRGWIRLARGEHAGAREDAARGLAFAREAKDPQALFPTLALSARVALAGGNDDEALEFAEKLLEAWSESATTLASFWTADLAAVMAGCGRGERLLEEAARPHAATRWLEAACALAAGKLEQAADLYGEIGSAPDEAFARLRAAERLIAEDRRSDAETQLKRALAFYRRIDAKAYLDDGEALLTASI